jgi:hypothetical protein
MRRKLVGSEQMIEVKRRPNWPFLMYEIKGKMYLNPNVRESKYKESKRSVGEALL